MPTARRWACAPARRPPTRRPGGSWRLLSVFETTSYGELWSEVKAVAAVWSSDEVPVGAGDVVASIGFASADYLRVDLAFAHLGLVSVPLQHNFSLHIDKALIGKYLTDLKQLTLI
jgi:fatty acid CoA ligase FadD9